MQQSNQIENLKPFVKWVGGKSSSVNRLLELMPEHIDTYVEPFVGSGALFFAVNFKKAIINDVNEELINTYKVIKDNVGALEFFLSSLIYDKQLYDTIRAWDRDPHYKNRPKEDRAGRFIYPNAKFHVNSSYRCPAVNKAVGGSETSQHQFGQAIDIDVIINGGVANAEFFNFIKKFCICYTTINNYIYINGLAKLMLRGV